MTSERDAWAGLAEDVGRALLTFAEKLRAAPEPSHDVGGASQAKGSEDTLGGSQVKVLDAIREAGADGLTSHQVAKETGLQSSNTPNILRSLARRELVVGSDTKPVVWRAAEHD